MSDERIDAIGELVEQARTMWDENCLTAEVLMVRALADTNEELLARLAEVEAERDAARMDLHDRAVELDRAEARVAELETALRELCEFVDEEAEAKFAPGFGRRLGHAVNTALRVLYPNGPVPREEN